MIRTLLATASTNNFVPDLEKFHQAIDSLNGFNWVQEF